MTQRTAREATDEELMDIVTQVRAIRAAGREDEMDRMFAIVAATCIVEAQDRGLIE